MASSFNLTKLCVFAAVGYICAGSMVAILAGLPLFAVYLESNLYVVAAVFVCAFLIATGAGIVLIRYLVPRYGAKNIYEQDILIYMIGMLFMALTMNKAMFLIGIFITFGALAVFFYENFTRQVNFARRGFPVALGLIGWALGPIICVLVIALFSSYGLLTARVLFAHFIVIGFWVWIQRLSLHEEYADAPKALLSKHVHHEDAKATVVATPTTETSAEPDATTATTPAGTDLQKPNDTTQA
ncbi:MAG: hypothetical protein IAA31_03615 [Candidatus Anaerobiospirillum merdipullorum]|uniref:Uncharacterized protein n=1 Tax=Candidatus Anaerobiospirillum merdipullorum TaxID=2838450 RepID=A0A9E2KNL8_9GAMM|nr:hypothetical protein [Candidatus Anaerobiospirillum merdipullorum]